jgi:hypothetical protein
MAEAHTSQVLGAGPGRLCGRLLCRRSRDAGGARRRGEEPRRRLPLSRLHSFEGAAARGQGRRRGAARRTLGRVTFGEPRSTSTETARVQAGRRRQAHRGRRQIAKLRKVRYLRGRATLTGPTVDASPGGGRDRPAFEHLILATGSHPTRSRRSRSTARGCWTRPRRSICRTCRDAARHRRRLHRPRARHRLRRARQQA